MTDSATGSRVFTAHYLGRTPYRRVHALQVALVEARVSGRIGDTLLLLEHEPVITLGRSADASHIVVSDSVRARLGVDCVETGRGGDVTYHGPGQLVAYPILDLKPDRCDVRKYVRDLAAVMVALASAYGVGAGTIPDDSKLIGVWVDQDSAASWPGADRRGARLAKIGAIGVRLSRWVTMHGFAFNLTTDLDAFRLIVPCGIQQYGVTSVERITGGAPSVEEAAHRSIELFAKQFDADVRLAPRTGRDALDALEAGLATLPSSPMPT